MRASVLGLIALAPMMGACVSTKAPQTASGRPEVTISGPAVSNSQVRAIILSKMLDRRYRVVRDDPSSITVEKESENFAANLLLSTGFGGNPAVRVTYTLAEIGPSVRVVADMALVQNAGSGFERRTDVSQGADAPKVQAFLDEVAVEASQKAPRVARR